MFLLHVVVSGAYWELIFNRMSCVSCILKHTKAQHHHTAQNAITNKNSQRKKLRDVSCITLFLFVRTFFAVCGGAVLLCALIYN